MFKIPCDQKLYFLVWKLYTSHEFKNNLNKTLLHVIWVLKVKIEISVISCESWDFVPRKIFWFRGTFITWNILFHVYHLLYFCISDVSLWNVSWHRLLPCEMKWMWNWYKHLVDIIVDILLKFRLWNEHLVPWRIFCSVSIEYQNPCHRKHFIVCLSFIIKT